MNVIVTAGPTREYLDAVRFLSNPSSGRMGFAVARAAADAGHAVTLIAGPVQLDTPEGVERVNVVSARDMQQAVAERFENSDALIMAAAVADYRFAEPHKGKLKKRALSDTPTLKLTRNPDILAEAGRQKRGQVLIGFALETDFDVPEARRKLEEKHLDAVVLNTTEAFCADHSLATIITAREIRAGLDAPKDVLAKNIIALLDELKAAK